MPDIDDSVILQEMEKPLLDKKGASADDLGGVQVERQKQMTAELSSTAFMPKMQTAHLESINAEQQQEPVEKTQDTQAEIQKASSIIENKPDSTLMETNQQSVGGLNSVEEMDKAFAQVYTRLNNLRDGKDKKQTFEPLVEKMFKLQYVFKFLKLNERRQPLEDAKNAAEKYISTHKGRPWSTRGQNRKAIAVEIKDMMVQCLGKIESLPEATVDKTDARYKRAESYLDADYMMEINNSIKNYYKGIDTAQVLKAYEDNKYKDTLSESKVKEELVKYGKSAFNTIRAINITDSSTVRDLNQKLEALVLVGKYDNTDLGKVLVCTSRIDQLIQQIDEEMRFNEKRSTTNRTQLVEETRKSYEDMMTACRQILPQIGNKKSVYYKDKEAIQKILSVLMEPRWLGNALDIVSTGDMGGVLSEKKAATLNAKLGLKSLDKKVDKYVSDNRGAKTVQDTVALYNIRNGMSGNSEKTSGGQFNYFTLKHLVSMHVDDAMLKFEIRNMNRKFSKENKKSEEAYHDRVNAMLCIKKNEIFNRIMADLDLGVTLAPELDSYLGIQVKAGLSETEIATHVEYAKIILDELNIYYRDRMKTLLPPQLVEKAEKKELGNYSRGVDSYFKDYSNLRPKEIAEIFRQSGIMKKMYEEPYNIYLSLVNSESKADTEKREYNKKIAEDFLERFSSAGANYVEAAAILKQEYDKQGHNMFAKAHRQISARVQAQEAKEAKTSKRKEATEHKNAIKKAIKKEETKASSLIDDKRKEVIEANKKLTNRQVQEKNKEALKKFTKTVKANLALRIADIKKSGMADHGNGKDWDKVTQHIYTRDDGIL